MSFGTKYISPNTVIQLHVELPYCLLANVDTSTIIFQVLLTQLCISLFSQGLRHFNHR